MQPVFSNSLLIDAAHAHSDWMLDTNTFSHTGEGGSDPGDRMEDAGYAFTPPWSWGENVSWMGTTGTLPDDLTEYILDQHEGLFLSPGHRENILNEDFREIGIGQSLGEFSSNQTTYQASMITQNFATSGDENLLGGVAYDDSNHDRFYTPGEGLAGITVSLPELDLETQTSEAGGYQLAVPAGTHEVVFSGDALEEPVTEMVTIGTLNEKLDLVLGDELLPTLDPVDYATRFMQTLADAHADETVTLNAALTPIFARILSRQLEPDTEEGGLTPSGSFETLAPVFTFVASPVAARPPSGPMGGYSPAEMMAAHDAARFEAAEAGMQGVLAAESLDWETDGVLLSGAFEPASESSLAEAPGPDLPADDSGPAASLAAYADWALV
ncbi:MAG: CAP domain-containing protein, partial [Halochromatium sp.]|uniref:CAP domain-containing protein n=1 Tax=Halochromatium sp. TaxID=2049430 RepID=UPI00397E7C13